MEWSLWTAFLGASLLLAAAPGPDNLFVLAQPAAYGARAGMIVVLGLITGLVFQTAAAALGLAAVVAASPVLFTAIKLVGAAYLAYLAVMAWRHPVSEGTSQTVSLSGMALWRRGVIMNVTNPKVQIFFLSFFPQFVREGTEGAALVIQMIIQGVTFMGATLVVFGAVAWGAGSLADRFRRPKVQLILNRSSAVLFAALAVFTVLS